MQLHPPHMDRMPPDTQEHVFVRISNRFSLDLHSSFRLQRSSEDEWEDEIPDTNEQYRKLASLNKMPPSLQEYLVRISNRFSL